MANLQKVTLFWFRRDLRLDDNSGLYYALQEQNPVLPVFIFDTDILDSLADKQDARLEFIHQSVSHLHQQLQKLGSTIIVKYGKPLEIFRQLIEDYNVASVFTNRDYEPYALQRDRMVEELLQNKGIGFYSFKDHVIFEKREILTDSGEPYKVFTPFSRKWKERLSQTKLEDFSSPKPNFVPLQPSIVPPLHSLGFKASGIELPPASTKLDLIKHYDQTRNFPSIEGTTRLGIHLRHGTLSIRKMVKLAASHNETWLNELIWREFYIMILSNFPHVVDNAFKPQYNHIPWRNQPEEFEKWCLGKTGFPIVDAGMRQLNQTGFMHNRVRMVTASFLTKHLLIDWRWGEAYFAQKLLDFELASNNGGWQWAAGTGTDAQPYFRVFNPDSQTEKFDKDLKYIKRWILEWGTSNYPKPMVDHKFARERAINTYKEALKGHGS